MLWNGTPLTTQVLNATQVQALVPASLLTEEGSATVSVTEDHGTSGGLPFTVTDALLTLTSVNAPARATEAAGTGLYPVATFSDGNTGAPVTDFTAIIAWGDGTTSTITSTNGLIGSGGSFVVLAGHTYAEEITTATVLSVQILDIGGASLSANRGIRVAVAPLP